MTYLAFDVARCSGLERPCTAELDQQCVDCLRRTAPWNPYRQVVMLPPEFSQGRCPERIAPHNPTANRRRRPYRLRPC